jgi:putative hemolysin
VNPVIAGLIGLVVLLLSSFLFSATQNALSNVRRQTLRELAERGSKRARQAVDIAEDSTQVLSTFQLANIITRFLIAGLVAVLVLPPLAAWAESLVPGGTRPGFVLSYLIVIPLVALLAFVLTGLLPQVLTQRNSEGWAMILAPLARVTIVLLAPLVRLMMSLRRGIAGPLGGDLEGVFVTEETIKTMVDAGQEEGSIELDEKEMIYSIFELDETLAREIMVPRIDIVALDIDTPLEEAREVIIRAGHSRIPVYQDSLDHIKGLLYAKDLLDVWHKGQASVDLSTLLRPALFVPESKRVLKLLRELQNAMVHLAIVIDEYGGTAGLVTIEDVVEEIVGEIIDEYDEDEEAAYEIVGEIIDEYDEDEEAAYEIVGEDEIVFDARIDLDDLNHLMDTELPGELSDTLGGFIYERLGKVPDVGEIIKAKDLRLEVLSVENLRIGKVRVTRLPPHERLPELEPEDKNNHALNKNGH